MTQINIFEERSKASGLRWAWIPGLALLIKTVLFGAAFLAVFLYSVLIRTGEEPAFYEQKAQVISPIVAILLGFPLILWACRSLTRRFSTGDLKPALYFWLLWVALDIPVLVAMRSLSSFLVTLLGASVFAVAAYLGGKKELAHPTAPNA